MLLTFFVERISMEKIKEEIDALKQEKEHLDQRIDQETQELEALKNQAFEMKVRRIVLEELLKKY